MSMSNQQQWQLEGSAPELYQRYLVPAITALWAADLIDQVALRLGDRALDVACGTGVVARLAADHVGPNGRVTGLDLNPGMLAVARSLPSVAGVAVDWQEGSALALPFRDATFDVALCQLGLQFFPDRPTALREMRRVLTDGGRVGLSVFGPIEHNPATFALANALDRYLGPEASLAKRTEHVLADSDELRALIVGAGFQNVMLSTDTKWIQFPSPAEYVRVQLAATPLASLMTLYSPTDREHVIEVLIADVGAALEPYTQNEVLTFPQEVHTVLAER
jgi:ubiquinone/menaquinone biosynthesis C-methylase UbiE